MAAPRSWRIRLSSTPTDTWPTIRPSASRSETARSAKLADGGVEVYNVPGAGGTIGLSQLASKRSGDPDQLMVMGLVMVGAIATNDPPVDLTKVTPLASLTTEPEIIVVPAKSRYRTLRQLVDAFKADPRSVSFAGGSAGGTDQLLVGLLAQEAGIDGSQVKYVAYSGGGEAKAAILSGSVAAGVSGVSEFADQIEAGKMRALAVSTAKPVQVGGRSVPTIRDAGYDVELTNWRGIVGPPGLSTAERDQIVQFLKRLHGTPEWQRTLKRFDWTDFFRTGPAFERFLRSETTRVDRVVQDLGIGAS
jgi:putative tricarboxylic transport membrane protein